MNVIIDIICYVMERRGGGHVNGKGGDSSISCNM